MADEKISDLPAATIVNSADIIPIVQSGTTKKAAANLIGRTPGGSDTQVQFDNAGAFDGAANLTYDPTQLPGPGSTNVVTIGPPESTLDSFVRGFASPEHTLFTSKKASGVGYDTTVVIETSTDSDYAAGLIIATMISPATTGSSYALQTTPLIGGSGTVNRCIGYEVNGPTKTGTPTISNSFGIQIDDQNPNNIATNAWGIFIVQQSNGYAIGVGGGPVDLGPDTTGVGQLKVTAPIVPNAANAAGVSGTIAWDTGFIYVCVATNTWKRVAIATW